MFGIKSQQDVGAGLLFMAIGFAGLYFGRDLVYGAATQMGPGYFPTWLSWIIIAIGTFIAARGLVFEGPAIERPRLRPILLICTSLLAFGFLLTTIGLALTVMVT